MVVTKLDRLARSLPDARDIAEELTSKGVALSLGGNIYDPTDPIGRLLFNVLGIVAEFEADLIRMRTREGMAIAKAIGRLKGKQPKLTKLQRTHLLEIHAAGTHTRAEMAEMFAVSRTTKPYGWISIRYWRLRMGNNDNPDYNDPLIPPALQEFLDEHEVNLEEINLADLDLHGIAEGTPEALADMHDLVENPDSDADSDSDPNSSEATRVWSQSIIDNNRRQQADMSTQSTSTSIQSRDRSRSPLGKGNGHER